MKKKTCNCYAIYYCETGETFIVNAWDECQKKQKGHNNKMRGFKTEEDARAWLAEVSGKPVSVPRFHTKPKNAISPKVSNGKVPLNVKLTRTAMLDFRKRSELLQIPMERLAENLILEYLYDEALG